MAQRRRRSGAHVAGIIGEPQALPALLYNWASSDERRAFHFFQHITAPCLSGELDGAFWRVLVLQVCQSEPAVRHAILAVSILHEGMVQAGMTPYANVKDRNSFALHQYNRAIACLLDQMRTVDARPLVPLLTCLLFVCIELMQSKDRESLLHLEQGRQILNQLGRKSSARNPEIDLIKQHLVPIYTRLSLTSLMLGGTPVEIPTPLKTLTELPMVFESIDEVRYALYDFMDECLRFAKKSHVAKLREIPPDQMRAFEKDQDYLLRKLARFNVAFSLYRATKSHDAPAGSICLIQIHIHSTSIWVSTALSQHETAFDDHIDAFSAMIPLATEFLNTSSMPPPSQEQQQASGRAFDTRRFSAMFTFEMHIIAPLYFVAAKCRHPLIRRAALDLLQRNPARRENLWRANVMAAIAERTMRLEEKHLAPDNQPHSQHPSPPELIVPWPGMSSLHEDPWSGNRSDAPFYTFGSINLGAPLAADGGPSLDSFDTYQGPVTSSCSSSSATGSADAGSLGDVAGQMPIDPELFFDPTEVSTAHSFSAAPSIASSLDDLAVPPVSTPYLGTSTESPSELWSGTTAQAAPGSALEPATPLDSGETFILPLSSYAHSRGRSRSHSRPPSRSRGPSSLASDGSPALQPTGMETGTASGPNMSGFQAYPNLGFGQLSPTTGLRSSDAPYDVPERFRVHESIIGPDKEDGTSWVMMFRKLGGLNAEWDVMTEAILEYMLLRQRGGKGWPPENRSSRPTSQHSQPSSNEVVHPPQIGDRAPSLGETIRFPHDKPVLVVFLRHCGCPFAEKTFKLLTNISNHHPKIHCVAVSQSTQEDTDTWIVQVGGEWEVQVIVDPQRELYHAWGLGLSSTWYAVNPLALWHAWKLGTEEGIWNRNAESGSRWQIGGAFGIDAQGFVRWGGPAASADDVPDFKEALRVLGVNWVSPRGSMS
ncbi:hypothetical protein N657DRAFT_633782 [Parathielavia appendiculata]|uniref:Uncharacterized protein n=1 Tax=Parathielavia appendiculata TaxID=2587402 RepID=A0AAN6TZB4_9PEZI|nr:hypothetical protein N657DRAFT_633782 [Parathielavia appendiculata]